MIRDLSTLQANADLHAVLELLKRWRDKSDNQDLKEFEKMMINISLYIWQLQNERKTFDNIIDRLRSDKLRAIQRARRVEEKLEEYEKIQRKNDSIKL
tara:strand:+ start:47 stop:340 length:294 start_codon:yes stop_codon:yes gene_type:complete